MRELSRIDLPEFNSWKLAEFADEIFPLDNPKSPEQSPTSETMKKFVALGFAVVLVVVAALLWQHFNRSKLTGTWVFDFGDKVQSVITVAPNGSYVCHFEGLTNGRVVKLEGTMQIKDGFVIDLCTNDSQTNASVPRTMRGRIIRMTDHEMVLKWDGMKGDAVLRKVER